MIKKLISAALVTSLFSIASVAQSKKNVTLEDVARFGTFFPERVSGFQSLKDGDHYAVLERVPELGTAINQYAYTTGELVKTLTSTKAIEDATTTKIALRSYNFSTDESKLLIPTETESIYRHSSKSKYLIFDLISQQLQELDADKQMLATFSPSGNQVAFVKDNNLYYKDLESGKITPITKDGERNKIINGASDWVYEEEFGFDQAFFWSPDGQYIAYYRFDEERVREFSMDIYGDALYPTQDVFKYPKAGEDNALVTIHIYSLKDNKSVPVKLDYAYEYIPRVKWTAHSKEVCVYALNRHQNEVKLFLANSSTGSSRLLYEEKDAAYVAIDDDMVFLSDGSFIWSSERDGYNHLYHIGSNGKIKTQITKGKFDITQFYGYNAANKTLYFQAAEDSPMERHVYSVGLNGKKKQKITQGKGTHSAQFNTGYKYFIHNTSQAFTPPVTTLRSADGTSIRTLEDNAKLGERLSQFNISEKEFMTVKGADGEALNAWMIKPTNFNPAREYPVLLFVYGGPGSQTVKDSYDSFNDYWYQYLASKGYIVVSVDNRGTGARGAKFKKVTYQQLGKHESDDQIAAAKSLSELPYVDANRIGIWGWSYGGYMSSLCLAKGNEVFKMAIAVAPVTNWRFYDSIYTERYMRTPQENASGYDDNSPINHVAKIKGKLLLIHGTADDNVHVQNSMAMTQALINANVQFDQFMYPDKNHGIYGGNTRYHLYTKMTQFLLDNL